MTKKVLYILIFVTYITAFAWLGWNYYNQLHHYQSSFHVCLLKNITGIACPSCGTTAALLHLLHGNFMHSVYANPLGLIVGFLMIIIPVWILTDLIFDRNSFYPFYLFAEVKLRQKTIHLPLILLLIINWIWNIYKQI